MTTSIARLLFDGIKGGDVAGVETLLQENPKYRTFAGSTFPTWLHHAARYDNVPMIEMLLRNGFGVNANTQNYPDGALMEALDFNHYSVAKALLEAGADPNQGKTLLAAISRKTPAEALKLVQLLVQHGADVMMRHPVGSEEKPHTPWSWSRAQGHHTVADYLLSQGAVEEPEIESPEEPVASGDLPEEAPAIEQASTEAVPQQITLEDPTVELLELMKQRLGPCQALVVQEAAGQMPVSVYVSPASETRKTHVLFTLGLSLVPMRVPEGKEAFRYAELMLELPEFWPLVAESLATPEFGWPIQWLLTLARYPYTQKTWLGAPVTIIENGNPPQPLAPNTRFTAMLLLTRGTDDVAQEDGTTVKLYKLIPLYPEECQIEKEQGLTALFTAFDESKTFSDVIDVNRPSVVKSS